MRNNTRPASAILSCVFTVLFILGTAPALRAQIFLNETFDDLPGSDLPANWDRFGNSNSIVTADQACAGKAYRINPNADNTVSNMDTPDLNRGSTPGSVRISFDLRITDLAHEDLTHYKINGGDEEDLTVAGNECHQMVSPANYRKFDPGSYSYLDVTDGAARNGHLAQFTITSFSGGGGGAGTGFNGALPVDFLAFTGEVSGKVNHLWWTTAGEENTASHAVERSSDGRQWTTIGEQTAAGVSNLEANYEFDKCGRLVAASINLSLP